MFWRGMIYFIMTHYGFKFLALQWARKWHLVLLVYLLAIWKNEFYTTTKKNPCLPFIMSWKRYIDDVFLFWKGSVSTVLEFVRFLNEHFADWCFTLVHSSKEINLFGIIVTKKDKYLSISLYSKPIEIHYFTLQVFSLKNAFVKFLNNIITAKKRCYKNDKEDWLRFAENKVDSKNRKFYLVTKKPPKPKWNLVFCTTITTKTRNIKEIIVKHWHILWIYRRFLKNSQW